MIGSGRIAPEPRVSAQVGVRTKRHRDDRAKTRLARGAGVLVLIFLILVLGSNEHIGRKIVVPAEAGPPLGAQWIGVNKLSDRTNSQFLLFNSLDLLGCDIESGLNCNRYLLSIFDWFFRNGFLDKIDTRCFPIAPIPKRRFSSDEFPNGFSVANINYREFNFHNLI